MPAGSPSSLARALNDVLGDQDLRAAIGGRAYEHSRRMVWSAVGAEYGRVFGRVTMAPSMTVRSLPLRAINA